MATTTNLSAVVSRWRNREHETTGMSPMAAASSASKLHQVIAVQQCICLRTRSKVTCISCGYFISAGRVRTPCLQHPNQYFLLDISTCPNCHAAVSSLREQGF